MKPKTFIGCSPSSALWAEFYQAQLSSSSEVTVINQGVLTASNHKLRMLKKHIEETDFALLILTHADCHDPLIYANILVLIGLCIGEIGHNRTFIVISKDCELPEYLEGYNPLQIDDQHALSEIAELAGPHLYPIKQSIAFHKNRFKQSDMKKNGCHSQFFIRCIGLAQCFQCGL